MFGSEVGIKLPSVFLLKYADSHGRDAKLDVCQLLNALELGYKERVESGNGFASTVLSRAANLRLYVQRQARLASQYQKMSDTLTGRRFASSGKQAFQQGEGASAYGAR